MQPSAPNQPSSNPHNFAGFLATIASPSREEPAAGSVWGESDLGEDVATLSYERALRAHARYEPPERVDFAPTLEKQEQDAAREQAPLAPERAGEISAAQPVTTESAASDGDLRTASVTIRLSKIEHAQLHRRAAEAGVTVSAYLRSCTFEVESLRAQVKEALTQLRSATQGREQVRLARVLGHVGKLWVGLSSNKRS